MISKTDVDPSVLEGMIREGKVKFAGHKRLRIYGTIECQGSGKKMDDRNLVYFESEADATTAGFRPCGSCMREAFRAWKSLQKGEGASA